MSLVASAVLMFAPTQTVYADDESDCTSTGGDWVLVQTPAEGGPTYGCTCPTGQVFSSGQGCIASTSSNFQEVDFGVECEGNSEDCCNGVRISVGVDCVTNDNPILGYFAGIVNFLSFGVGIVIVGAIVIGGIQYATSGGVPQRIEAARSRITNAIIALVIYIFMFAILQWLIPGGIFNTAPPATNPGGGVSYLHD